MTNAFLRASLLCLGLLPALGHACDVETGARQQRALLDWHGRRVADWHVDDARPRRVELPDGFVLGVAIEAADDGWYAQRSTKYAHFPEMVRIALFDLGSAPVRELTVTWGGANSIQDYGARGGADRVEELGDPGIRLVLLKPVCVDTRAAAAPTRRPPTAIPASAPAVQSPASATTSTTSPDAQFGLPEQRDDGVEEIVSRVAAGFRGWGPNSRIRLENGQEWQVVDGSSAKLGKNIGPGVRIVRAAFGSYRLKLDGLAKAPKVRRVK